MLRTAGRRAFSTSPPHHGLLNRLGFVRRVPQEPTPLRYNVRLFQGTQAVSPRRVGRAFLRYVPIFALLIYFAPIKVEILDESTERDENGTPKHWTKKGRDEIKAREEGLEDLRARHGIVKNDEPNLVEGEKEDEDEEDDEIFFFPLSLPKLAEKEFYKGSDPEWQEFMKFSKDKALQQKIHADLVQMIRGEIAKAAAASAALNGLGTIDVTKGRMWVDIVFPQGPPREYYQFGLSIGTSSISLVDRLLTPDEYRHLERLVNPSLIIGNLQHSMEHLLTAAKFVFGVGSYQEPTNLGHKPHDGHSHHHGVSHNHQSPGIPRPTAVEPENTEQPKDRTSQLFTMLASQNVCLINNNKIMASMQKKNPQELEPPRGCILMTGLVEVVGSRGVVTVDLQASYNVETAELSLMHAFVRRAVPYKQRPRPG